MKMFLTRLGENSKMIINGDLSQVDLPSGTKSGLRESIKILDNIQEIGFIEFGNKDVVRNPLVSKIVNNYEKFEKAEGVGKEYFLKSEKKMIDLSFEDVPEFKKREITKLIKKSIKTGIEELQFKKIFIFQFLLQIILI